MSQPYVCPSTYSGSLDNLLRKMLHKPSKILSPYVKNGMTVFDIGCGPGYFTVELARLAGEKGKVVAADLQQEMLDKMQTKVSSAGLMNRVEAHLCRSETTGIQKKADFILLFWMVHEVPDKRRFLSEVKSLLNTEGRVLICEPKIHVTGKEFADMTSIMTSLGFKTYDGPSVAISRTIIAVADK